MTSGGGTQFHGGGQCFHQGLVLPRQGFWKEAAAAYKESLRVNPGNAQTYLNLGFVYYELGYDREAQNAFDSFEASGPFLRSVRDRTRRSRDGS